MRRLVIAIALVALSGWTSPARGERKLSLADAVRLALENNTQLELERAKVAEADATRKSVRGRYGPMVTVQGNVLLWDSELALDVEQPNPATLDVPGIAARLGVTPAEVGARLSKYSDLFSLLPALVDLGNIRDQVTGQVSVTLAQPLTPLLQVHSGHRAAARLADAARQDHRTREMAVAHQGSPVTTEMRRPAIPSRASHFSDQTDSAASRQSTFAFNAPPLGSTSAPSHIAHGLKIDDLCHLEPRGIAFRHRP